MRNLLMTIALALTVSAAQAAPESARNTLIGDYVEARTASVFAGPCHFNGELTTTGREAQLAWKIKEGVWNGVSLTGLTVMAAVVSDKNLYYGDCKRKSVVYLDEKATEEQEAALMAALKAQCGKNLGCVLDVKRAKVTFEQKDSTTTVEAKGFGKMVVAAMPNNDCCKMPSLVCHKPLVELKDRKVGYTRLSGIKEKILGPAWTKQNQNTAFYGTFSL